MSSRRLVARALLAALSIGLLVLVPRSADHDSGAQRQTAPAAAGPPIPGYWMVASDGGIFSFEGAAFLGSTGAIALNRPIVGMAATPAGDGYRLVASDGGIFGFGNAEYLGSTGDVALNRPIVGMAATPSGNGYWLVASDGGIFNFGDAPFLGSTGDIRLNRPIVGMAATPSGNGYWLVASDGGIFNFGDAPFLGSTGDIRLNRPIVGMAATPSGNGYWLVASDGGIFNFGDAAYLGSTGDVVLNRPVVGMAATPTGNGYWLVATDGGIFTFGDAAFLGSTGDLTLNRPVVGMALGSTPTTATATVAVNDPVLAAAGDIACDPESPAFNAGQGTTVCRQKATSDLIADDPNVTAVAVLGDVQYECGGLDAFQRSYHLSWGRFKAITYPAVGNHEYLTAPGTDCDPAGGAGGYFSYFGSVAGNPGEGYYSYDLRAWHIVVLNSNCVDAGGCGTASPQGLWLASDLASRQAPCTLAYWHHPRWSSGGRATAAVAPFVSLLHNFGADVILTGHDHTYERFAPQRPDGSADPAGIRQFVVGTGGSNHTDLQVPRAANSEVSDGNTFGVLKMTLHQNSYDWAFAPEAGGTFSDSGSAACH